MSVKHLLQSIAQDADRRVAEAKKSHAERMRALEADHERKLDAIRKDAQDRLNERKRSLREKAESLGRIAANKLLLEAKNKEIDAVYASVSDALKGMDKPEIESFFRKALETAGSEGGVIRAAKEHEAIVKKVAGKEFEMGEHLPNASGGFILSTDTQEWNFTFDFLVTQSLRPATEIDAASALFA